MELTSGRVYAKIVGDLFHPGHVRFLQAARSLGNHLTVCVVPDSRVVGYKGRKPIFTHDERLEVIASCKWVDEVIGDGPRTITLEFMQANNFNIYAFGAIDENELAVKLRDCTELPEEMRRVVPYLTGISTSIIKERVLKSQQRA